MPMWVQLMHNLLVPNASKQVVQSTDSLPRKTFLNVADGTQYRCIFSVV